MISTQGDQKLSAIWSARKPIIATLSIVQGAPMAYNIPEVAQGFVVNQTQNNNAAA